MTKDEWKVGDIVTRTRIGEGGMKKQELKSLIDRLDYYNRWRRGEEDLEQPNPKQLGRDIETVLAILGAMLSKLF